MSDAQENQQDQQDAAATGTTPETPPTPAITQSDAQQMTGAATQQDAAASAEKAAASAQAAIGSATGALVSPAPVVAPAPTPAPAPEAPVQAPVSVAVVGATSTAEEVKRQIENLMKDASIPAKIVLNTINEYLDKMKPGMPISVKDGTQQQVNFYQALISAINNLEADFRPTLTAILALFHHHREGALRETHVFRFVQHVPLSKEHRKGFEKIVTLLKTLADPKSRQAVLKQVDFQPLLAYGLTEKGRTRLTAYFGK
ncbi:hypothetical protein AWB81_04252 [Caballeronia arationis]|uniref:hypothetical protein n=1 Tax=Caballeronia arationis TaxID=1777142 RepID=UPI00074C52AC|nr:hypothetical protein [Caballeronia arationis]SAK83924.1 hypothetical protein AWB81_04252 [Caballeronia arationis]